MDKTARKESIRLSEINFTPILIAVAVILLTLGSKTWLSIIFPIIHLISLFLVVIFLIKKRKPRRTDVLLAGLCDSGKTLLYSMAVNGTEVETFTSTKENFGFLTLPSGMWRIVDLPGHERLRLRLLDSFKNSTKALVYVIDSSTIQKEIKDVAEWVQSGDIPATMSDLTLSLSASFTRCWQTRLCLLFQSWFCATNRTRPCPKGCRWLNNCSRRKCKLPSHKCGNSTNLNYFVAISSARPALASSSPSTTQQILLPSSDEPTKTSSSLKFPRRSPSPSHQPRTMKSNSSLASSDHFKSVFVWKINGNKNWKLSFWYFPKADFKWLSIWDYVHVK